jgi:hypothetical protein
MLRLFHATWLILPAALLGGCPIYSDGCITYADCAPGYGCDATGACLPIQYTQVTPGPARCTDSSDCAEGLVCDRYRRCVTPGGEAGAVGSGGSGAMSSAGESGRAEGGSAGGG